jgi:hypothetical protein
MRPTIDPRTLTLMQTAQSPRTRRKPWTKVTS